MPPNWTKQINMGVLPTADGCNISSNVLGSEADPVWTKATTMTATLPSGGGWTYIGTAPEATYCSIASNILTIDTTTGTTEYAYYSVPTWSANPATGYTIEAKMKVVTSTTTDLRLTLVCSDGTYYCFLYFSASLIAIAGSSYAMSTTDTYHVYRMTCLNGVARVYVDGVLRITQNMSSGAGDNLIDFGDRSQVSGTNSKSLWEYVKYYTGGAYVPILNKIINYGDPSWTKESVMTVLPSADGWTYLGDAGGEGTTWTKTTDMTTTLPSGDGWSYDGTAPETTYCAIAGGILTIDTTAGGAGTEQARYGINPSFNNAIGYTIEFKMEAVATNDTNYTLSFSVQDGSYIWMISFRTSRLIINYTTEGSQILGNVCDGLSHIYRVTVKGVELKLYKDNVYICTGTLNTANAGNGIIFGDYNAGATNQSKSYWDYVYYSNAGSYVPTICSVSSGILTINTTAVSLTAQAEYKIAPSPALVESTGYTIEAKLKVVTCDTSNGYDNCIYVYDDSRVWVLTFYTDNIYLSYGSGGTTTYTMNTTDAYHIYRVTVLNGVIKVYVDGTLRLDSILTTAVSNNFIIFGDDTSTTGKNSNTLWDYVRYYTGGVYIPTTTMAWTKETNMNVLPTDDGWTYNGKAGGDKNPVWTKETNMGILPSADGWTYNGTAPEATYCAVAGGILTVDGGGVSTSYYTKTPTLNNTTGYTIELRYKHYTDRQTLYWWDGTQRNQLSFRTNYIADRNNTQYAMDTTDGFHVYRITMKGTAIKVYVDGILRINSTYNEATATQSIRFGCENSAGKGEYDYIWYSDDGEFIPPSMSVSGGKLNINTIGKGIATVLQYIVGPFVSTTGYTIEARKRVMAIEGGTNATFSTAIDFRDDVRDEMLDFWTDKIRLHYSGASYNMDTTNDFHTYRITVSGIDIKVYVDGTLAITATMSLAAAGGYVQFGDMHGSYGYNSNVIWDYVNYNNTGAFAPTNDPTGQVLLMDDSNLVAGNNSYYSYPNSTFNNATGYTIEAKIKNYNVNGENAWMHFYMIDDTYRDIMYLYPTRIWLQYPNTFYNMDTTVFHTYRYTRKGTNTKIYVDGRLVINGTSSNASTSKQLLFGNYGNNGKWEIDYLYVYTGGVLPIYKPIQSVSGKLMCYLVGNKYVMAIKE